jgi:hypothetical protein
MRSSLAVTAAAIVAAAGHARTQTANFDAQTEGGIGITYAENGLTFHDLDQRFPGSPPPQPLVIEDASQTLAGLPGFSTPNCLGFGGYSPGPGAAFGRMGSVSITPDHPGTSASIEVFDFTFGAGNSMNFGAYLNGQQVALVTVPLASGGLHHTHLEVHAQFDDLKFFGSGPNDQGVIFCLVDNVTVASGPACYANCDGSTAVPILNIADFVCFQQRFAAGDSYANCDGSTAAPVLNIADFVCFQQQFAAGCN